MTLLLILIGGVAGFVAGYQTARRDPYAQSSWERLYREKEREYKQLKPQPSEWMAAPGCYCWACQEARARGHTLTTPTPECDKITCAITDSQPVFARQIGGITWMRITNDYRNFDLFEYWIGDDYPRVPASVDPGYPTEMRPRLFAALNEARKRGSEGSYAQ